MVKGDQLAQQLMSRTPDPALCPDGVWDGRISSEILQMTGYELTGNENATPECIESTRAALLLWNDDLAQSHRVAQGIETQLGSYWHGFMHRREGDFSNAKYWFARVGDHPVFDELYRQACLTVPEFSKWESWRPAAFIDEVERTVHSLGDDSEYGRNLRRIQVTEFALLWQYGLHS